MRCSALRRRGRAPPGAPRRPLPIVRRLAGMCARLWRRPHTTGRGLWVGKAPPPPSRIICGAPRSAGLGWVVGRGSTMDRKRNILRDTAPIDAVMQLTINSCTLIKAYVTVTNKLLNDHELSPVPYH